MKRARVWIELGLLVVLVFIWIAGQLGAECLTALEIALSGLMAYVLAVTAGMVWKYAAETQKLRELTKKSNEMLRQSTEFSALIEIHQQLGSRPTYRLRRLLYTEFDERLGAAVKESLDAGYLDNNDRVKIDAILERLSANSEKLHRFNKKLRMNPYPLPTPKGKEDVTFLEIVERTLLPFDAIAVPFCEGIESAARAAVLYRPILERTAGHIIPFVAIQIKLRGEPNYKLHYLCLLYALCIRFHEKLEYSVQEALRNREFLVSLRSVEEMRRQECKRREERKRRQECEQHSECNEA